MSISFSRVLVTAPHSSINHFEIDKAGPSESQVIRCAGRNWIYLFIQSNNGMNFPGEMWELHLSEQSGRFTEHKHNYKQTKKKRQKIQTSGRRDILD